MILPSSADTQTAHMAILRRMNNMSTLVLWVLFALSAAATWAAGLSLSRATDALDVRWKLGETLGGMILLAFAGTLPEVAITVTAALGGHLDLAAGNLLGGIAVQTGVLVICDFFVLEKKPLSYLVGSLMPVLEASLVIGVTTVALLGTLLPRSAVLWRMSPASVAIVLIWVLGIWAIEKVRDNPKWQVSMEGCEPGRCDRRTPHKEKSHPFEGTRTPLVVAVFAIGSLVTLGAGVMLTLTSSQLASRAGINGVLFGATILALATALPEISTGIEAVRLGDNQLAMGDIFGGNAFQLTLFAVADLVAGSPVLPHAGIANSWLAGLGVLVTVVYASSVVMRPEKNYLRVGLDSLAVLLLLVFGMAGLALIAH